MILRNTGPDYLNSRSKRFLDFYGATELLHCLAPLIGVGAVVSALDTRSFPLIRQERRGLDGKNFQTLKFQTLQGTPPKADEITETFGTHDPRATRIGNLLRRATIDELPQLYNVLKGDIHLVGIRPELAVDLSRMEALDPILYKHFVRAYDMGAGAIALDALNRKQKPSQTDEVRLQSMEIGVMYAEHASLIGDLDIIAQTVPVALGSTRKLHMLIA